MTMEQCGEIPVFGDFIWNFVTCIFVTGFPFQYELCEVPATGI